MEDLESWIKAGKIAAKALEYGRGEIKKEASLLDVTEKVEKKIIALGGGLGFPVQISLNHIAAHSCPEINDIVVFSDQLVKIDVGVEVKGCIGDNACTVDLSGNFSGLVKAAKDALDAAVKMARPGQKIGEIGATIKEIISGAGFSPIRNLSGHGLAPYDVHSSPMIPNFDDGDTNILEDGMIIAVEPFATNGAGIVIETANATVFALDEPRPVRDRVTRQILEDIKKFNGLPFAKRWLQQKYSPLRAGLAIKQMLDLGALRQYPPLAEKQKGFVSQAEHTVLVGDIPRILTKNGE